MFRCVISLVLAIALSSLANAQPLSTAFTFQGQLQSAGAPVTGAYDVRFRLYDALTGGTQIGSALCSNNIAVANGLFTIQLDFGSQFSGQQRFLEVDVRRDTGLDCSNPTGFTTLSPRQPLTAIPNALYSLNAAAATTATSATTAGSAMLANTATNSNALNGQPPSFYTNAANLTGSLPSPALSGTYNSALNLNNTSNAFSGSGAGLTNIPYAALTGAPTPVLLQSTTPGTVQSGNLDINGAGIFGSIKSSQLVSIGSTGLLGSLLSLSSSSTVNCGLVLSGTGGKTMSFNMNLDGTVDTTAAGAAVRVSGNNSGRAIQFSTRAAGSSTTVDALNIGTNGNIGLGSNAPDGVTIFGYAAAPTQSSLGTGAFFDAEIDGTIGIIGVSYAPNSGYGVQAYGWGPSATGLYAVEASDTGTNYALHAIASSPAGYAGFFEGPCADAVLINNTGSGRGLHATTVSDTAIWGQATNAFAGIDGRNGSATGRGVFGFATSATGINYGVLGQTSSTAGFGVYSSGNTGASGTKSFRIDHPDDPAHKYLFHYATESPEAINFYRGSVTLNQQGEATIDLPPYFAKINKDPSYQLTAVGAPMPLLHVSQEISDTALADGAKAGPDQPAPLCSFTIAGGSPNGKVCWRIEAQRNDRWVQAHGAPIEAAKQGPEDGTYEHPDLYNQPVEKGAFYHEPPFTPPTPPKPPLPPRITSAQLLRGDSTTP